MGVEADVVAMFARAAEWGRLAGLVNNAGVLVGPNGSKSVADADIEDLQAIMRVNVVGPVLCWGGDSPHVQPRGSPGKPLRERADLSSTSAAVLLSSVDPCCTP